MTRRSRHRGVALLLAVLLLALAGETAAAGAAQTVTLKASFSPDRLGTSTTLSFSIHIAGANGQTPSPVTAVGLRLPAGLGLFSSTLGETTCDVAALRAEGVAGCPPDSLMGLGSAVVKTNVNSEELEVPVKLDVIMAPAQNEHTALLFYAEGVSSVIAELVFPSLILGDSAPYSSLINTSIPRTPTVPGAPDVALISMRVTIGPRGLLYSKRVHGKTVHFRPKGMEVPQKCPSGGFPFSATFNFEDNTAVTANTKVACPPPARRHAAHGHAAHSHATQSQAAHGHAAHKSAPKPAHKSEAR